MIICSTLYRYLSLIVAQESRCNHNYVEKENIVIIKTILCTYSRQSFFSGSWVAIIVNI